MSKSPSIYVGDPDALSAVLSRLHLSAEVYVDGDFCGAWAVDTSGSRRIPFHLIGRGEAWLHSAGESPCRLNSGDLVLLPPGQQHFMANSQQRPSAERISIVADDTNSAVTNLICGFFEFRNRAAWPLLDSLAPVIVLDLQNMSTAPQVRTLIDLMVGELTSRAPGYCTVINQLAYLLFIEVLRQQISAGAVDSGLLAALFDPKISKALSAIHNHPDQRWNLESLAGEAAMGRSAFASRFADLTGTTPVQYLTAWRMQEATALLTSTGVSILEIAERSGYESEAAFRKAYKKSTGVPPGAVRRGAAN